MFGGGSWGRQRDLVFEIPLYACLATQQRGFRPHSRQLSIALSVGQPLFPYGIDYLGKGVRTMHGWVIHEITSVSAVWLPSHARENAPPLGPYSGPMPRVLGGS